MVASFLFSLASLLLPVLLLVIVDKKLRPCAFLSFPLGLALEMGLLGVGAGLSYGWMPYGWPKLAALLVLATLACHALLRAAEKRGWLVTRRFQRPRLLLLLGLFAAVAVLDCFVILQRNGWAFEAPVLFPHAETYFRAPMNDDPIRNLVVIKALLRGTGTPFLPHTRFTYQIFWHHWAALYAGFHHGLTAYPAVKGMSLTTALLFFFLLFWSLVWIRPGLFLRRYLGPCLFATLALHADLFYFLVSLLRSGHPAIEADWSVKPLLLRNFSVKLAALTAPQHALFLLFLMLFLAFSRRRQALAAVAFLFAFLVSPVLSVVFFFFYFAYGVLRRFPERREAVSYALRALAGTAGAALGFWAVFRFPPYALFFRPAAVQVQGGIVHALSQWACLPVLPVATVGLAGVLLLAVFLHWSFRRPSRLLESPLVAVFLVGSFLLNYLVTGQEVRRHFSVLSSLLLVFLLAELLPNAIEFARSVIWRRLVGLTLALGLVLHAYFLFSYTGKPSMLAPSSSWKDYFAMNEIVERRFSGVPVLAAYDSHGIGLQMPPVMEATTSMGTMAAVAVHSTMTPEGMRFFEHALRTGNSVPYAQAIGYELLEWGPVEEKVWGEATRLRFTRAENELAHVGKVRLFRLEDNLSRPFEALLAVRSPDGEFFLRWAEALIKEGWIREGTEKLDRALALSPEDASAHFRYGQAMDLLGDFPMAILHFQQAVSLRPASALYRLSLGVALYKGGRKGEAMAFYRQALQLDPALVPAYNDLAAALLSNGYAAEAEGWLRKALLIAPGVYEVRINLGRALARQEKFQEALVHLEKAVELSPSSAQRAEAYVVLGEVDSAFGKREAALQCFREALRLEPRSEAARRGLIGAGVVSFP